jgi:hypothetical protein
MYYRPQGYISPPLISYKITQEDRKKSDDVPVIELVSGG